ncbi:WD40-repeat-containing domain protein [Roridomyces roridus]|uniref:WD40-repeat-containing domain protein n=1 Tax=Roridomyces roridus TaxID=1738132 RepID=A0AAD7CJL1_9AGAR|nr:WD40-repeat-containing domain protein [Roridomyces roridus]
MSAELEVIPVFRQAGAVVAHKGPINAIAISPNGKLVASAGADDILILNGSTLRVLQRIPTFAGVHAISWHPGDPGLLTFGTATGVVRTITLGAMHPSVVLHSCSLFGKIYSLSIRSDGRYLGIGYDLDAAIVATFAGGTDLIVFVSQHSTNLTLGSVDHYLPRPTAGAGHVTAVLFHSTDSTFAFVSYKFGRVSAFSYRTSEDNLEHGAQIVWTIDRESLCGPTALSPSSRSLVSLAAHGEIFRLRIADGHIKCNKSMPCKKSNNPLQAAFVSESIVAVSAEDGGVYIQRLGKHGTVLQTLPHDGKLVIPLVHWGDESRGESPQLLITGTSEPNEGGRLTIWKGHSPRRPWSGQMRAWGGLVLAAAGIAIVAGCRGALNFHIAWLTHAASVPRDGHSFRVKLRSASKVDCIQRRVFGAARRRGVAHEPAAVTFNQAAPELSCVCATSLPLYELDCGKCSHPLRELLSRSTEVCDHSDEGV